jgi:hypothetical protein
LQGINLNAKELLQFVLLMALMPFGYVYALALTVFRKTKEFNYSQQANCVIIIFALFIAFSYVFVDANPDRAYLQTAFIAGTPEGFLFPLLYYITIPFYFCLGNMAFTILSLWLFGFGLSALMLLFQRFKLNLFWLPVLFATAFFCFNFLAVYTRNNLDFFLACWFAYFFFIGWYENKTNIKVLLLITVLMWFSTPNASMFLLLCFVAWAKTTDLILFLSVVPTSPNAIDYYVEAINKINSISTFGFRILFLPLANYINLISLLVVFAYKDKLLLLLFCMNFFVSIMSVLILPPDSDPQQLAFRYGFVFVPLQMFLIAKLITENWRNENEQRANKKTAKYYCGSKAERENRCCNNSATHA